MYKKQEVLIYIYIIFFAFCVLKSKSFGIICLLHGSRSCEAMPGRRKYLKKIPTPFSSKLIYNARYLAELTAK